MSTLPPFVFFGTPDVAHVSLEALHAANLVPALIVTAPDKPSGRGLQLTPSPVAQWAQENGVPVLKPKKLSDPEVLPALQNVAAAVFVVVAYGKIIPPEVLAIPPKGTLNMHPSLLPKHRGPSPIESQILHEERADAVGVSIMLLDEEMDHGPILAQQSASLPAWPIPASQLRALLSAQGAQLLVATLPEYLSGARTPVPQDDSAATYCAMIQKEDAQLDLSGDPEQNYRKILAYDIWPRAHFFAQKNGKEIRVIVTKARLENGELFIESVIPEGKKEISYEDFLR